MAEFYQDHGFTRSVFSPTCLPVQSATLMDLVGGDRATNADIARRLLRGEERGPKRDAPSTERLRVGPPKAEPPAPEAPKAEEAKPETPQAEAPKPETPKVETPKPETPKGAEG